MINFNTEYVEKDWDLGTVEKFILNSCEKNIILICIVCRLPSN